MHADTTELSRLVAEEFMEISQLGQLRTRADNIRDTFRGFPFSGKIRYLHVFVRRDGRWQAVAMQQTPLQ